MTENTYHCSMCESECELIGTNGHWLKLYCEECDMEFERPAYEDMGGVSIDDLRSLNQFTDTEE